MCCMAVWLLNFWLFFRCWWNGAPCDVEKNFKTTITRLGYCYTFNSDALKVKKVYDTGRKSYIMCLNNSAY